MEYLDWLYGSASSIFASPSLSRNSMRFKWREPVGEDRLEACEGARDDGLYGSYAEGVAVLAKVGVLRSGEKAEVLDCCRCVAGAG